MNKHFLPVLWFSLVSATIFVQAGYAKSHRQFIDDANKVTLYQPGIMTDSAASRATVIGIINTVIKASAAFDIDAVADLYTPNAVVADEEPPFSWNGQTAGVQWVSTVEKTCKDLKLKEFKASTGRIKVYLQTDESIYVVVPVDYSGEIKGEAFNEDGAFTFIFRMVGGKWLIKSQVWVASRGL